MVDSGGSHGFVVGHVTEAFDGGGAFVKMEILLLLMRSKHNKPEDFG
jgi:hypothetical protein